MNIKISTEKIWWDDIVDNKPDNTYFTRFKNSMVSSNIKINMKSYALIEVVVPDTNITYIWVNQNSKDYYYYYNKVLKIMDGSYLLEFKLDLFTTFTLPYFEYLRGSNINVKMNRHKKFTIDSLQWEDEMINSIPLIKTGIDRWTGDTISGRYIDKLGDRVIFDMNLPSEYGWGGGTLRLEDRNSTFNEKQFFKQCFYMVFSDFTAYDYTGESAQQAKNGIVAVPILSDRKSTLNLDGMSSPPKWWTDNKKHIAKDGLYNGYDFLSQRVVRKYPSKCLGVFLGPPFWMVNPQNVNVGYCDTADNSGVNRYFIWVQLQQQGIKLNRANRPLSIGSIPRYITTSAPDRLNKSDSLSVYASNIIDFKINGNPVKLFNFLNTTDNPNRLYYGTGGEVYFNFTSQFFLINKYKYYSMENSVIPYVGELPLYFDRYNEYIQNTRNTRDTGLNIAAQNAIMGTVKSFVGGAASLATGDVMGVANAGMSLVSSTLGFYQKQQMIDAELKDKRSSMGTEIKAGNINDAAIATLITFPPDTGTTVYLGEDFECVRLAPDTIKALNNVIYLYGIFNPMINSINYFTDTSKSFNYYKFDAEYLSNIFTTTIRGANSIPIQREYYSSIFNYLTGGVRMWKEKPQW